MEINIDRIVKLKELEHLTGYKKSAIYEKMADGTFPKRRALGAHAVGWFLSDIQKWLSELPQK